MPLTAAQQQLAAEHVSLARSIAWKYVKHSSAIHLDDAESAALLGLVQATETWIPYCARNSYDPSRMDYYRAYVIRRMKGAILDQARANDHLTRTDRQKAKALRAAEDAGAQGVAELAAATGLDEDTVRRVQADAQMAISLDERAGGFEGEGSPSEVADEGPDTESQAVVSGALAAALAAFDALDVESQVILALVYCRRQTVAEAAGALRLEKGEAERLHDEAVLAIHAALLAAVRVPEAA